MKNHMLLKDLSRYTQKWSVVVRVLTKTPVITFQRKRASIRSDGTSGMSGKIFSVTVIDREKNQMTAKFWDAAADKYYNFLEIGKVYVMKDGDVALATNANSNSMYELAFTTSSTIVEFDDALPGGDSLDSANAIPQKRNLNSSSIRQIKYTAKPRPFITDIVGVVTSVQNKFQVMSKKNESLQKKVVTVGDATRFSIDITLWNDMADLELSPESVICITDVQINDYRGRQGSTTRASEVFINATEYEEVVALKNWFSSQNGGSSFFESISNVQQQQSTPSSTSAVRDGSLSDFVSASQSLIHSSEEITYRVCAMIDQTFPNRKTDGHFIAFYRACSKCNKKVNQPSGGGDTFECSLCHQQAQQVNKLVCQVSLIDTTGGINTTLFGDSINTLSGISADTVSKWVGEKEDQSLDTTRQEQASNNIDKLFNHDLLWQPFYFVLKARPDTLQGELRTRIVVVSVSKVDNISLNRFMLDLTSKLGLTFEKQELSKKRETSDESPRAETNPPSEKEIEQEESGGVLLAKRRKTMQETDITV